MGAAIVSNYLVVLTTATTFRGPALMKRLKEVYGEDPVSAGWAIADRAFGFFLTADTTATGLYSFIRLEKSGATAIHVYEVGPDWCSSDRESRGVGWLQGTFGEPKSPF